MSAEGQRRKKVLFLCAHNSARSQMAEGLLRALYGDRYEAFSAGTHPVEVHPLAIRAMAEIGVDISSHRSKSVDEFRDMEFDCVVTLCDDVRETCPFFPRAHRYIHKGFEDPASLNGTEEETLREFRRVRDEIREWIDAVFGGP